MIYGAEEIDKVEEQKLSVLKCLEVLVRSTYRGAIHKMITNYYSAWEVAHTATCLRSDIVWPLPMMTVTIYCKNVKFKFRFTVAATDN